MRHKEDILPKKLLTGDFTFSSTAFMLSESRFSPLGSDFSGVFSCFTLALLSAFGVDFVFLGVLLFPFFPLPFPFVLGVVVLVSVTSESV